MRQHRDGYEVLTAVQALAEAAEKRARRIPENPIHTARLYLTEHEADPPKSYAAIARQFGVSRAEVCYHIALVKRLPWEFVDWLEQCEDPDKLRVFTERRLRPIARFKDSDEQGRYLRTLLDGSQKGTYDQLVHDDHIVHIKRSSGRNRYEKECRTRGQHEHG